MKQKLLTAVGAVSLLVLYAAVVLAWDPHGGTSYYFFRKDSDMDFHFGSLVLGAAPNGGAAIGEAFYVANHISDGNAEQWQQQWYAMAQRVEARGQQALHAGHRVSGRDQLLRAASYYRTSVVSMSADNPEFKARILQCRKLMRRAGALLDPPLEYVELPFEGTVLPAYFRKAHPAGKAGKTLLMIGGGETFIEDLFFYIAPQAHVRGYNFMTVDLPGQGLLPFVGQVFRTDTQVPMQVVVDYLMQRPEVEQDKVAAYGFSGGGLFVPQAAQHDPRIKAIAMSSAVLDAHELFKTMPATTASPEQRAQWTSFHAGVVKAICWRYGVDQPAQLIAANANNTFEPSQIKVPALILIGEAEYSNPSVKIQQDQALQAFGDKRSKLIMTPTNEGATNHCLMENRSVVGQVLFDWLDEIFAEQGEGEQEP